MSLEKRPSPIVFEADRLLCEKLASIETHVAERRDALCQLSTFVFVAVIIFFPGRQGPLSHPS